MIPGLPASAGGGGVADSLQPGGGIPGLTSPSLSGPVPSGADAGGANAADHHADRQWIEKSPKTQFKYNDLSLKE